MRKPLSSIFVFSMLTLSTRAYADIQIGAVQPLTGPIATFGTSAKNAFEMAFEKINAAGGIKGQKLKLTTLDDQGKPEEAATAVTRLITRDKVVVIMGALTSSNSLAAGPIAQANKIPMVSNASTNPKVTQIGDYIFRTCYIDPFQGAVIAKFATESLKVKTAAIFQDLKSDYSAGLSKFFKEKFIALGGTVVSEQVYSAGDIDFKAQLTAIKAAKPDFVYLPGYYTDIGLIVRQARELGLNVPFGGGDGWDSEKIYEIGGKALDGSYFSGHFSPEAKDPVSQKFIADYKAKYGSSPDSLAALGYDTAMVVADALTRAKSLSGPDLRDALATTKNIRGATGIMTFGPDRNPVKASVVLKIEGNKQNYVTTVNP